MGISIRGVSSSNVLPSLVGQDIVANSVTLTGDVLAQNLTLQNNNFIMTAGASNIWFNSTAAAAGAIVSGISAANAGTTAATAGFKFYPVNALDATDWVLSVGNANNASSLFNISYSGAVSAQQFINSNNSFRLSGIGAGIYTGSTAGTGTGNGLVVTGSATDGSGAIGIQFSNSTSLATAGALIAAFYPDNFTTKVSFVDIAGVYSTRMGTSTSYSLAPGVANVNSTAVGNAADTTEDTLMSYSLPANSLSANNKGLRITAWGDGVSTADVTTVRCYFGATVVVSKVLTASQANTWKAVYEVLRTGATAQIATGLLNNGGTAASFVQSNAAPAETLSGAVTIKCTGQRATTSAANSVRQLGMIVEVIN